MCGIVGYTGVEAAAPILLGGLEKLAYRGYDSAGLALTQDGGICCDRAAGKLGELISLTKGGRVYHGNTGIGHTRWATHGAPNATNAHPHLSQRGTVAVVHNGIIENWRSLKDRLASAGYIFSSDTDTEVIPHLLEGYLEEGESPLGAILKMIQEVRGAYALGILFASQPEEVWCVRRQSPLIVAEGERGCYLASDVPAVLDYTRAVYYLEEGEVARLSPQGVTFYHEGGQVVTHTPTRILWEAGAASKGVYDTYMEKELFEIPTAIRQTISQAERQGFSAPLGEVDGICVIGCGSAYHVGMVGKYLIEERLGIPVLCESASEVRYRTPPLTPHALGLAISQSGETADTLVAVRQMKHRGVKTLGVVNVYGSSIARECDHVFYTQAGPEIAVATTKAYCAQACGVYLLLSALLKNRGKIEEGLALETAVRGLPACVEEVLTLKEILTGYARMLREAKNAFFIGRGLDYAVCMEGALKLREITYLHAEAYAAGELKHGTISLIEKGVPVVAVLTQPHVADKTLSAVEEVRARGGEVILFADSNIPLPKDTPYVVRFSAPNSDTAPLVAAVAMQYLAYLTCREKGLDPDQPRNLAKSVTVE